MQIQAHRGASCERPQNTMAAFVRAAELGADGIELDVHILPDRTIIVDHDGQIGNVSLYNYRRDSIRREYPTIPYFTEVLEFLQTNDLFLNVEIKVSWEFYLEGIEDDVIQLLEQYGMRNRCIISSFRHDILAQIKKKYPAYAVGILYSETHGMDVIEYCQRYQFDALHPWLPCVDQDLVNRAHDAGLRVNVWTVDSEDELNLAQAYGVDGVITNDVATAKQIL